MNFRGRTWWLRWRAYHALTQDEQAKAAIFCDNYGKAAAIDFLDDSTGCRKPSAAIRTTSCGGRETTQVRL